MMQNKLLFPVAGLLIFVTLGAYWYVFLRGGVYRRSPDELVKAALEGGDNKEREKAALELSDYAGAALPQLRQVLREGKSPEVRGAAILGLAAAKDWDSIPDLFQLMEDDSPVVRGRAGKAVADMLGADYFFRADDPPARRKKTLGQMRQDYERISKAKAAGKL